jgi:hypothetical protein
MAMNISAWAEAEPGAIPRRTRSARKTKYAATIAQATISPNVGIVNHPIWKNGINARQYIGFGRHMARCWRFDKTKISWIGL